MKTGITVNDLVFVLLQNMSDMYDVSPSGFSIIFLKTS